ncbi:MAG: HPF/RaiA family ribosome-associated protein [Flavobacteriaceae bacterium]|jgi:putative sigma-54 modulation protein|nr:HPF/RaiA family ribosome-associated protein [Flavobacteriaceae bacterium]|tara:strand:- start:121 stop:414 length:294 start_codon:yes stop_codon:yes gene_type:complete
MTINIQSINFTADAKLIDFAKKRIDKLEQFYDKILNAEVIFKVENASDRINKFAEVKLRIVGDDVVVKKICKTFEEAIDLNVRAAERILKKRKETVG